MMTLRLQMLTPVSAKCNWNRRMSSNVAVSGDRFRKAANRLQLRMCPRCVPAQSLRAFISSIMRWRSGLTVLVVIGSSCLEVDEPLDPQDRTPRSLPMISPLGITLAAQAWCSRLSRKRFSAMALHFLRCIAAKSDTIGGIADMPPARRGLNSGAYDPTRTLGGRLNRRMRAHSERE